MKRVPQFVNDTDVSDTPLDLSPASWFRADATTIVDSCAAAAADLSGHGRDATQVTVSARPDWLPYAAPNSKPAWSFNGMQSLVTAAFDLACMQLDLFTIVKLVGPDPLRTPAFIGTGTGATAGSFAERYDAGDYFDCTHYGATNYSDFEGGPVDVGVWHFVEFRHDKTVSSHQTSVKIDGIAVPLTQYSDGDVTEAFGNLPVMLGGAPDNPHMLTGLMCDVVIVQRLVEVWEVDAMKAYARSRYRMTIS